MTGSNGTFVYRLHDIRVDGKVAREGGQWKVSCCVPGAGRLTARWPRAQTLTTARLVLEPLRPDHARELAPVLDDPALHAFTGGAPESEEQLHARYTRQAAGQSPDGARAG